MSEESGLSEKDLFVRAEHEYETDQKDELALSSGAIVKIINNSDPDWWYGEDEESKLQGWFPSNFVVLYEYPQGSKPASTTEPSSSATKKDGSGQALPAPDVTKGDECSPRDQDGAPHESPDPETTELRSAKVLYDYMATSSDEMTVQAGAVVQIVSQKTARHGWWKAASDGERGLVPSNVLELSKATEEPEQEADTKLSQVHKKLAAYGIQKGGIGSLFVGGGVPVLKKVSKKSDDSMLSPSEGGSSPLAAPKSSTAESTRGGVPEKQASEETSGRKTARMLKEETMAKDNQKGEQEHTPEPRAFPETGKTASKDTAADSLVDKSSLPQLPKPGKETPHDGSETLQDLTRHDPQQFTSGLKDPDVSILGPSKEGPDDREELQDSEEANPTPVAGGAPDISGDLRSGETSTNKEAAPLPPDREAPERQESQEDDFVEVEKAEDDFVQVQKETDLAEHRRPEASHEQQVPVAQKGTDNGPERTSLVHAIKSRPVARKRAPRNVKSLGQVAGSVATEPETDGAPVKESISPSPEERKAIQKPAVSPPLRSGSKISSLIASMQLASDKPPLPIIRPANLRKANPSTLLRTGEPSHAPGLNSPRRQGTVTPQDLADLESRLLDHLNEERTKRERLEHEVAELRRLIPSTQREPAGQ